MVDISSQEKKINIKIQSGGAQANVGVTQDTAQYYSEKAREWAISNKIVDRVDYSSKYYANISKTNALQSAETRELLQSEYNEYSQNLLDIATTEGNNAISAIQSQQTTSVNAVKTEGITQVNLAKAQATAAANSATQASNVVKEVEGALDEKVDIASMVPIDFSEVPCIVETYVNGTSWYRVYSDGWKEQGGQVTGIAAYSFLKPFSNTDYTFVGNSSLNATKTNYGFNITDMNFGTSAKPSVVDWYACGY